MEDNLKYIVYLTTNLVNNKIYIGVHKTYNPCKFDGYLGCGVNIHDRSTYRYCHTPFETAVNKYGPSKFIRKTLKVFDKLEDALDCERWLVDNEFISRKDTYNVVLGGGIPSTKVKVIYQYTLEGKFIKKWPSITEASIYYQCSSSSIGKAIHDGTPSLGFLWAEYKTEKLDLEAFHLDENKTPVYLYNMDGKYLGGWKSLVDAAKNLKTTSGNLVTLIRGKYLVNKKYYASNIKYEVFPIPNISYKDGFYQYDLEGNFIKHYKDYSELCLGLNTKAVSAVYRAIRTGNTAFDSQWFDHFIEKGKQIKLKTTPRKVGKYTKEGELVQIFNSVREAKKDTCGAPNVLSGDRKTAGGYIWKYLS